MTLYPWRTINISRKAGKHIEKNLGVEHEKKNLNSFLNHVVLITKQQIISLSEFILN